MTTDQPTIGVLIVAGGIGSRMGGDVPKQYLSLHGKTILAHTIDIFENMDEISTLFCVIGNTHEAIYQQVMMDRKNIPFCFGGKTRQESVYKGLKAIKDCKPDIILIHDAARPCVKRADIRRLIHRVQNDRAATLAQPVTESLQRDGEMIDRDNLWMLQTPQGFYFQDILRAHETVKNAYTDDTAVYHTYSGKVASIVACGRHNLKITNQDDMIMAEKLLSENMETITGQGFDVHAFDKGGNTQHIRLCGIDVAHQKPLEGHSDADIGLHVLTDAILSTIANGDIGQHFPSSDDSIKNMDSHHFLDKALSLLKDKGGQIRHIDITFICEAPNIGQYRDAMRAHLSDYLDLPLDRISIKGTTAQKLGFTGRGEGIAAQAIVTVRLPASF